MSQIIFFFSIQFVVYFSNFISARHRQRKYKYLQLETDQRIIIEFPVNKLGGEAEENTKRRPTGKYFFDHVYGREFQSRRIPFILLIASGRL